MKQEQSPYHPDLDHSVVLLRPITGYHLGLTLIMRMVKEVDLVDNKKKERLVVLSFLLYIHYDYLTSKTTIL